MSEKRHPYMIKNLHFYIDICTMKCECTNFYRFKTRQEAKQAIFEYIEVYYNRQRRHSKCGWMPPKKYKRLFNKIAA